VNRNLLFVHILALTGSFEIWTDNWLLHLFLNILLRILMGNRLCYVLSTTAIHLKHLYIIQPFQSSKWLLYL